MVMATSGRSAVVISIGPKSASTMSFPPGCTAKDFWRLVSVVVAERVWENRTAPAARREVAILRREQFSFIIRIRG